MTSTPTARPEAAAVRVCALTDLVPERGSVALVDGAQVAIVRTHDGQVYAIDNRDPYSGAQIIARGLVGTRGDVPTIVSPMYKQIWDLRTGACLDGAGSDPIALRTWPVRVVDGAVLVGGAAGAVDRG
ncbi:nitrite reductase small subunit [Janibacter sp. Soil728]|uniref:nitrite reductase small subunit NirD n=1 Tax=Janibacter sp. Soil728 TaxID=1736393 RepID=UPI0006FAF820|nr:nitrite reductase small subunit NirD [Janibacter sp. Soil728]KRE37750.1 nitrite reductase small subunit [Janibacter sp. Soil728]